MVPNLSKSYFARIEMIIYFEVDVGLVGGGGGDWLARRREMTAFHTQNFNNDLLNVVKRSLFLSSFLPCLPVRTQTLSKEVVSGVQHGQRKLSPLRRVCKQPLFISPDLFLAAHHNFSYCLYYNRLIYFFSFFFS